MSVFLIGFMCVGKTTVGRALAQELGYAWLDLDRALEAELGPLLPWINTHGEAAFREQEQAMLERSLHLPRTVISCGGGTPMVGDNMEHMLAAGTVVHLRMEPDALVERCARKGGDRPLLFGLKGEALRERIVSLLAERAAVYARAHHVVRVDGTIEAAVADIRALLADQER